MKNVLTTAVLILTAYTVQAQNGGVSASVSINATATVIESIELSTISNINFGRVSPGVEEININPRTDDVAGKLLVSGRPNAVIRITYPPQRELIRAGGTETLTFTYFISGNATDNQFTSEFIDASRPTIALNEEGRLFIWIGGQVNISNAVFGNYEGEFSIEIEYI